MNNAIANSKFNSKFKNQIKKTSFNYCEIIREFVAKKYLQ